MDEFAFAGPRPKEERQAIGKQRRRLTADGVLLALIVLGCVLLSGEGAGQMDLSRCNLPPNRRNWFGTDAMGRDLFRMIWEGGKTSLLIGFGAAGLSALIAIVTGGICGLAPRRVEVLLNRLTEILLSVPGLLLAVLLQAVLGKATPWSLAVVIGATGWTGTAKVAAGEVRRICGCDYVAASRAMGGSFFHILRRHLAPNCVAAIAPMTVMSLRGAIAAEAALSFMGMGLPLETVSWGSILSQSEQALLGGEWWLILIPGGFLVMTLLCVTSLGNRLGNRGGNRHSYL